MDQEFWIGLHGLGEDMFKEADVFVGFRRKRSPQQNPSWCEIVYVRPDKKGRLVLQAYNYNYVGMPFTPRKSDSSWRVKVEDELWICRVGGKRRGRGMLGV